MTTAEQLKSVGAGLDEPVKRKRWSLGAATPLRLLAQHHEARPIPLAAAHAATGLHTPLGVIAGSQDAVARRDVATLAAQTNAHG